MADAEITQAFPPPREANHPFDPPPELLRLSKERSLSRIRQWDGVDAWLIARYEDVKQALNDKRLSADPRRAGFPEKSAAYKEVLGRDRNLRTMDNPEHSQQKSMLVRDFSVRRVDEMRPAIQKRVDALISQMLEKGSKAEIVSDFALAIPTMVICEMLGVPYADRDYFTEKSHICTSSEVEPEAAAEAAKDLYAYMETLIDRKDTHPENDLMSRLVVEQLRTGNLSRKDVIELARFILIAGHETTANMIALSVLALLVNPDQLNLLRHSTDPAFVSNAVDELFRYLSITHTGRRRVAVEDLMIGEQVIRAGEGVIILNNVADRDETVFSNAGALDVRRPNVRLHMAFGAGMHRCIGAYLSKIELEIVHSTLWRRIPRLALAVPFEEIEFYEGGSVYGVRALPVHWS